jgi:hypothetical protein
MNGFLRWACNVGISIAVVLIVVAIATSPDLR